ncbi:uncharacterized protein [Nicotiana tomentosiformis]|uniref:uncharacterized protein n=1 Tax=Nicotiana tomentosiformis TaxID=4098 RepID=UPI00388C7B45
MGPAHFDGDPLAYAHDFLDGCQEILQNIRLVEPNGVDFTTFQLQGSAKRWWQSYERSRPTWVTSTHMESVFTSLLREVCSPYKEGGDAHLVRAPSTRLYVGDRAVDIAHKIDRIQGQSREAMVMRGKKPHYSGSFNGTSSRARGRAQVVWGCPRDGGQSGGDQACCYAFLSRPEVEASSVVITYIISVFHRDASVLFDPGSTYSHVTSYFASHLDFPRSSLDIHVHISTPIGDSIVVDYVHQSCSVTSGGYETSVNLMLLNMVDFDVILAFVRDVSADTHAVESVLVVMEFPNVFPIDLPGMPPYRDIDFGIDLLPGTQPTSIQSYSMALAELKELKEQLQEFHDKGFIRPCVSQWAALFVKKKNGSMRICTDYSVKEHEQYLRNVLQILREMKLYAKFSKCEFWIDSVTFLGHVTYSGRIKVDPKKIEVVQSWPSKED